MLDPAWYDKLQINMREARAGFLGIHVFKAGHTCRYFEVPLSATALPEFFEILHDLSVKAWGSPDVLAAPCPNCGQEQRLHRRRYQGYQFCGFCGTAL